MSEETISLVNRAAIVVKPKQSFIEWANHFNDGGPVLSLEEARRHPDVFLVDDLENESKPENVLGKYYRTIFEHELEAWMTDEDAWPLKRDLVTFRDWFDIDICIMVFNLVPNLLREEAY